MKQTFISLILGLSGSLMVSAASLPSILELRHSITDDNIIAPESFETQTRLLEENFYLKNYVVPGIDTGNSTTATAAEYEQRLAKLPTVIDLPYNSIVGNYIDMYLTRKRGLVADMLALHNMNTLHFHITDDQGWRFESKKYPRLNSVGSWRDRTVRGYLGSGEYDHTRYGGYYTQDELRDLVKYAADRHVTIVPEIDMPGHMLAALAAYPELGCTGGPYEVCPDWGVFEDVLCIGNDKTVEFLEGVFDELIDIFPSKLIHIGGDECPRDRWAACPKCQARIKTEGLVAPEGHTAEDMLQSWITAHMEKYLNERGRSIIGWDEILNGEVAPSAWVMSWRGSEGGIKAAQMGHDVVMTPNTHCYFDFYQTDDTSDEPLAIGGCTPVEKVYNLDPVAGLTADQAKHIKGVQANLWTEYIHTPDHIEYMVLPRMSALAEVQWTPAEKEKNYDEYVRRADNMMKIYRERGWNYGKHLYNLFSTVHTVGKRPLVHRHFLIARQRARTLHSRRLQAHRGIPDGSRFGR